MAYRRVLDRVADHIVVADGAMGSELLARLPAGAHLDLAPLEHPKDVLAIHLAYLQAGAELIETATFAASRPKLDRLYASEAVEGVNSAAVKLAREAREISGVDCLVAGSIGPLAGVIDIDEPDGPGLIAVAHAEQAAILAGRGADLLILETFFRLDELRFAIEAVRDRHRPPARGVALVPIRKLPESHPEFADQLRELFASEVLAAGINSAPGPQATHDILEHLGEPPGPIVAMPNAGSLVRRDGRILLPPATPSYLAQFARRAAELGAGIIGGCCGTGPDHIRAISEAVRGLHPVHPRGARIAVEHPPAPMPSPQPRLQSVGGEAGLRGVRPRRAATRPRARTRSDRGGRQNDGRRRAGGRG
jgi:homocysteine S-methyltransferase